MGEAFSWPEGQIWFWTGTATASALAGYAQDVRGTLAYGWLNYPDMTGVYHDVLTGQRADLYLGTLYCPDNLNLWRMMEAKTAVHVHVRQANSLQSGGFYLYSGRIDSHDFNGDENTPFKAGVGYHANSWSGY